MFYSSPVLGLITLSLATSLLTTAHAASDTAGASVTIVKGTSVTAEQDLQFGAVLNGIPDGSSSEAISMAPDGTLTNSGNVEGVSNVAGANPVQPAEFSIESADNQVKNNQSITIEVSQDFTASNNGGTPPSITALNVAYDETGTVGSSGTSIDITGADIPASATSNLQVGAELTVSEDTNPGVYDSATITVTSTFE